jgi:protein required for attachment to host cells
MDQTWIILANAARARIFEREPATARLVELTDLVHPQSRQMGRDLATDRPGHAQKAHGDAGHAGTAFESRTDARDKERSVFAAEVSRYLEDAVSQGRCPAVVIMASDPFLGTLRAHLGQATLRVLRGSIPLDLSAFDGSELARCVSEELGRLSGSIEQVGDFRR